MMSKEQDVRQNTVRSEDQTAILAALTLGETTWRDDSAFAQEHASHTCLQSSAKLYRAFGNSVLIQEVEQKKGDGESKGMRAGAC